MPKLKQIEKYLDSASEVEIRAFIERVKPLGESVDDELKLAARESINLARRELALRELLRQTEGPSES